MAAFKALLGLKRGTRAAGILITFPVRGFRPLRAARLATAKVPKPTSVTRRPRLRESRIAPSANNPPLH